MTEDEKPANGDEPEVPPEVPPPATFAGRQRAAEKSEDDSESALELRPGFTEEFDSIERDLDRELADLVPPRAEEPEPVEEAPEAEPEPEPEAEPEPEQQPDDLNEELGDEVESDPDENDPPAVADVSDATVEAETISLADQEQAKEAALAGLRARAAKQGAGATAAASAAPPSPPSTPTVEEGEKAPRAKRVWARFLAASVLIVASVAAATSISILVYLTDIAKGLSDNDALASLRDQLEKVDGGDPQTILIIGSDKRLNTEGDPGRSDTTILLRVDPDKDRIALLSIPRDLRVTIPGVGLAKFNEAFSSGGADKTLAVVQRLTGLDINHVVNINFTGFADAVNAIGGVYVDVDRRYYIPPETGTSEIDIEAGYQLVKGYKALQYVRFRHFDNDLVRSARQQDFLREARQKLPPGTLINDREELLNIFTEYTTSDIGDAIELLKLLKTFAAVQSAPVLEVHFPAELGTEYVTANDEAIQAAVNQFLATEGTPGGRPAGESPEEVEEPANEGENKPDQNKPDEEKPDEEKPKPNDFVGPTMDDATEQSQASATQLSHVRKKNGEPMVDFPIFYPVRLAPGSIIINDSRAFPIDGPGDDVFHGYKQVVEVPGSTFGNGLTEEYYGISGTDWTDVPILENPSEVRTIDGKDYLLFYDGDRLRTVGWKNGKGAYWVNNSLLQSLEEGQMLSIATSMRELDSK